MSSPPFARSGGKKLPPEMGAKPPPLTGRATVIIKNDKMQLFTLFRSQNKGLISTPIFTPNSFYNSLPYFTEKPANP